MADYNKDGGPAFPTDIRPETAGMRGMSLRDYFAAAALQGLLASDSLPRVAQSDYDSEVTMHFNYGKAAYKLADAMLLARK